MDSAVKQQIAIPDADAWWQAVLRKDATQDGNFYFGVKTTGVYCRPSCPARPPLRKNVRFYRTTQEAEQDGLRACRRCRPNSAREDDNVFRALCDFIRKESASGKSITLSTLSARAKLSPFHLQRKFKTIVGVTPKQYVDACRLEHLKGNLRNGNSVTSAIFESGYGGSSRVYERSDQRLGMTPRAYARGGVGVEIVYTCLTTGFGLLLLAATDRGLCLVRFGESRGELERDLRQTFPAAKLTEMSDNSSAEFLKWVAAIQSYLRGENFKLDLPLDVQSTAFVERVWRYLQSIPAGEVRTYSEVAKAIGAPKAARAVGTACGSNRIAIVVPCHRVLRGDSGLGGYRWGLDKKRKLLAHEGAMKQAGK
ncbi:MAG: bifunctional DNA-binding transcriptional regulator/O6-methylguanine-DNA methyltransferase Ada [Acidobacteriaceae bacterium]|nr:bifunctional DNA-binding transcriptional regulator/O6-methylguanine-DNA methyltransferase Ada [Acidobacteriaceae bacterium]